MAKLTTNIKDEIPYKNRKMSASEAYLCYYHSAITEDTSNTCKDFKPGEAVEH